MSAIDKRLDALEAARRHAAVKACTMPDLSPQEAIRRLLALVLSIPQAAELWRRLMAHGKPPGDPEADRLLSDLIETVKRTVPEDTRRWFTIYRGNYEQRS